MNNFDGPRKNEMDEFLNYLYSMSNGFTLNQEMVYHVLCYYSLKSNDKLLYNGEPLMEGKPNEGYFEYWKKAFENMTNTYAFREPEDSYFFQFTSKIPTNGDEFIKLYVPIDSEHLYAGVNKLFDFLDKNNIIHQSQVSKKLRSDNIVIRLRKGDREAASKIIDYVGRNMFIQDSLNRTSPFVPTANGVGVIDERANSYNYEYDLAYYIKEYVNICKSRNCGVNADNFKYFLEECKKRNIRYDGVNAPFDDSLLETFNEAYAGRKTVNLNSTMEEVNKNELIEAAFKATFYKYGMEHFMVAIQAACNGDYHYLTNGEEDEMLRTKMENNVNGKEVCKYINDCLVSEQKDRPGMDISKMHEYVSLRIANNLSLELDRICRVTYERHGLEQVRQAIMRFVNEKTSKYFSAFYRDDTSINYREKMKYYDNYFLFDSMKKSLMEKGLDVRKLGATQLIDTYVNALGMERSTDFEQTL